jgi:hypothetical protein
MSQIVAGNRRISQQALLPAMTALALAACTLAAIACMLALAPAARAGEWAQRTCRYNGEFIGTEGWEGTDNNGYKDEPREFCETAGYGFAVYAAPASGDEPYAGQLWTYKPPHDSTIAGGTLNASLTARNGLAAVEAFINSKSVPLQVCEYPTCEHREGLITLPAGASQVSVKAVCLPEPNICQGPGARWYPQVFSAEAEVTSPEIILSTDAAPKGAGFSGTLLHETVSGTGTLDFTATDPGPGVYQVRVKIDGNQVLAETPNTNNGKCSSAGTSGGIRVFDYAQPCPTETAVRAEVQTASVADGTHTLTVEVEDAAGDAATVYSGTLSTLNHLVSTILQPAPARVRGPANGAPASESATLTAEWKGESGKSADHLASAYRRSHEVTGKLTTTAGAPIADALIEASQKPAYLGAIASTLASTHTATNGSFTISVPRTISSTSIQLAYRSHLGDAQPVATHTLTLQVPASLHLTVAPHVSSIYHRIVFTGMVHGAPIPPGGKQLVLEARSPGHEWIQFDTLATDANGHYRASYRFKFSGPIAYQFRVVCKHEADFPFLAGSSNVVRVWER